MLPVNSLTSSAVSPDPGMSPLPEGLRLAVFDIDATPPVGSQLAYNPVVRTWDLGQRVKGIVLLGAGRPIVMVSFDWLSLENENNDEFRRSLAVAAGTIPERVVVHTTHVHDAIFGDLQNDFVLAVLKRLEMAVRTSLENTVPVTHISTGEAQVYKVASNRRIHGPDGKIRAGRMSTCKKPENIAEPEGVIDPMVSGVSFWNNDQPVAVLTFYATHPQSYYLTGVPNPDFPGVARFLRQLAVPDALHIHFTGAGGNVAAGKYNDGSHENRLILAERLADGMKRAWESKKLAPIAASQVNWECEPVVLVPDTLKSRRSSIFVQRYKEGKRIDVQCLSLGNARILFLPGELFVEYQLAAKAMRPDLFVAMAAYCDRGAGYIPTAVAFKEGGYEVNVSKLTPQAEVALMGAMQKLLKAKP
jgi:hypothetical protein